MEEPRWLEPAQLQAWRRFTIMHMQLTGRLGQELAADGLSFQDYSILAALSDADDNRERAYSLGQKLGWEKSRLSHHITRMVARGLVTRERCPTDQRGSFVVMTEAGRSAMVQAAPGHVTAVRRYFIDQLTPAQIRTIDDVSQAVLVALESDTLGPDHEAD